MRKYWTYDKCKEIALKCKSRSEFKTRSKGGYDVARKNGWLDEWFGENTRKPCGYWNYDTCREEALKYKSRNAFYEGCIGAYHVANKNNWLDDYDWFEIILGKWTYDTCKEEALKYNSRSSFMKGCVGAYDVALKNGWLDDYDWMQLKIKPNGYWDYEKCKEEALKYKSRGEFCKGSIRAYQVALKNGWLNDYTWFEIKWEKKWNHDTCMDEAKKYNSRGEFCKGNFTAYNAALKNGWLDEYDWFVQKHKPNGSWNYYTCKEEAKKFNTRTEFMKGVPGAYAIALKNGWLNDYDWFEQNVKPN